MGAVRKSGIEVLVYIQLILICLITVSPLAWVVSTSLKTLSEVAVIPPTFFPRKPTIKAYVEMWSIAPFARFTLNSLIVSLGSSILALVVSSLAAFGIARFRFRGVRILLTTFLLSQMFPGASVLIPVTQLMLKLRLYSTRLGLILVYTTFFTPFSTWMLYGYFRTIPMELEEVAFLDGCSRFRGFLLIILPLTVPGLGAVFVFCFLGAWNEFLFAFVLNNADKLRTLPVGMANLIGQWLTNWNVMAAGAIVFAIPSLVLFLLLEKALIRGLMAGAIKG